MSQQYTLSRHRGENYVFVTRRSNAFSLVGMALCLGLAACSGEHVGGVDQPVVGSEGAPDLDAHTATVVARLELGTPSCEEFVLRGTIPVPRGLYKDGDQESPFLIMGPDGEAMRTQVEIVSRYPDVADGADVVEVLAQALRPQGSAQGDRLTYEVLWSPNAAGRHVVTRDVSELVRSPRSLVLRTTDVFGHSYQADLFEDLRLNNSRDLRVKRNGAVARTWRTHEVLEPIVPASGPTGTLPHLMGVHSYITAYNNEDFISLDLRVHNGHEGRDKQDPLDDPLGKVYFNEVELVVPDGWRVVQAFPSPSLGYQYSEGDKLVIPLVAPVGGNKLNMMPSQAQFHRRLVLFREGSGIQARAALREEGLAFCQAGVNENGDALFSWWNPETARFWAQNLPLPDLSYKTNPAAVRQKLESDFESVLVALATGSPGPWPIVYGNLGWSHPWGLKVGNMVSGSEIVFFDGLEAAWAASNEGYRTFQMSHRMYTERHPTALYALNGNAFRLEDWIVSGVSGNYLPTWMFMVPWLQLGDPFGFNQAPTFQVQAVQAQGRQPDYEPALAELQWIDAAHLIRYTRSSKVLAWLGNDALAKDDLHLQAELCRANYTALPQNDIGQGISTGQFFDRQYLQTNPHDGFVVDRGEGWEFDTVASAYALADPRWRRSAYSWFTDILDTITLGLSTCSGTIMSKPNTAHFGGQYRILQSISECILQNGLWGAASSVFAGADPARLEQVNTILRSSTLAMISEAVWDPATNSPHFYTALGPWSQSEPSFCGGYVPNDGHEGNDNWQTWNMLLFGYRLTHDSRFMLRASQMAGGTLTPEHIGMDNNAGELETRAGMIAFLQLRAKLDGESFVLDPRSSVSEQALDATH